MLQGVIADEGTVLGSKHNLSFKLLRSILKKAPIFFNLTATPFGRDPMMLWGQMYLTDGGYSLGETMGLFRAVFYSEHINYWGGYEHTFKQKTKPLLHQLLRHKSIRYEANAADLPRVISIRKDLTLPIDAAAYYQKARNELIAAKGNYREVKNTFLRMRQISSGFIGYVDDETGTKAKFEFPTNPKLEMLLSLIEEIDPRSKIIVFHDYTYSGLRISRELKERKIGHVHLYSGTRDVTGDRKRYNTDADCRVMVLQNQFGIGLNLQVAQYGIYYESPLSVIMRKQTQRRLERQYSAFDHVFIYDLIVRGTVDEDILTYHAEGRDLFAAVVQGEFTRKRAA